MAASFDFGAVFHASPNAYMLLDRELRYVAANPAYLTVTGSRLEDLVGRRVTDAFPNDPENVENEAARMLRESLTKVVESGQPDVLALISYRVPRELGGPLEDRFWSATHVPIVGDDGEVAFVLQHTVDVTELQQLRAAAKVAPARPRADQMEAGVLGRAHRVQQTNRTLDAELRHLRHLFEQAPGFVCFLRGPDLVFELANRAYYDTVGRRELLGKPIRAALPELEGQGYFELLDRVLKGEVVSGRGNRARLQRTTGAPYEERFVDFIYQPVREPNGEVIGIFVQGNDVTEQKRLEAERERLAAIVDQSSDFVAVGDRDMRIAYVNEAGQRLIGLGASDRRADGALRDSSLTDLFLTDLFLPEDEAFVKGTILPYLRQAGRWEGEFRLRHLGSGAEVPFVPVHCHVFTLFDPETGEPRGTATISRDITALKNQQAERLALLDRERAARAEAERASRLKDDFLATVSHELRTPLNAILGWAQMLRVGRVPPDRQARALETIERNARTQAQLIDDLLDLGRIMSGKLQLTVERVDAASVVEAALDSVRPAAEAKSITVDATLASGAYVMGDPVRLQQIVWNLLSNAVKFTPKDGRVEVRVALHDADVEVVVADNGRGIAPSFLPYVFERFRQEEASITRTHGGLGLGLSIVKQLVELHGGDVGVASEGEGRGATFRLRIPRSGAS